MKEIGLEEIEEMLESIARLLEIKGENPFKVRAYSNGARALRSHSGDVVAMAREGRLQEIDGIGEALAQKVSEYVTTGKLEYYDKLRDAFPPEIFQLFELQGLGAKKIKVLHDKLQIHSIPRLERACQAGKLENLEGFGKKTQENLLKAIAQRKRNVGMFRMGDVFADAKRLLEDLRSHPHVSQAEMAGSLRRRKEVVHDADLLAASKEPARVSEDFAGHEMVEEVIAQGDTKTSVRLKSGLQCDLRIVSNSEFPFALAYFTGSREHNIALRGRALKNGWSMNEYRFSIAKSKKDTAAKIPDVHTEEDIHRALGLDFIPPELRENNGEFEAAESGTLPRLIEWENLRGTFHNHTNESDGKNTLEDMAQAAVDLGLEYLGIADHSRSSFQANGLDANRLDRQRMEIGKLNESYDGGFQIFAGVECDILKDGELDFDDEVLASLDYVVASVHSSFSLSEKEMTRRIVKAIQNPLVTMLGHPTGRLLLTRDAYRVNMPDIIDAAAETGTIIELNANPRRLDMDWRWWKLARDKGVKCSINPDAHSTQALQNLFFGVAAARKGWLRREDVVNCLPLKTIRQTLQRGCKGTGNR